LLQEIEDKYQRGGWKMKKKVKWTIVHLFVKKLMHRMNAFIITEENLRKKRRHMLSALLKEEELKVAEYERRIHYCEPGQGSFLGEDDDGGVDERLTDSLMKCLDQHKQEIPKASPETQKSHVF
jgi:hypothetical protein